MKNQKGNVSIIVSIIIVVGVIGLMIYALTRNSFSKKENVSGVQLEEQNYIKENMEQIAKNGDVLIMNYTGKLTDGTVFDSNVDPKFNHVQPFEFTLGAGQVIVGWDEGLLGMKVGEKKTLTIPPEKGYGSMAIGSIPPNSTLIFDVELVGIK